MNTLDLMALQPLLLGFLGWMLAGLVAGLAVSALARLLPPPTALLFRLKLAARVLKSHLRQRLGLRRRNPYFRIVGGGDG